MITHQIIAVMFGLASLIFAGAAFINDMKGYPENTFKCVMWSLGCAIVAIIFV